MVVILYVSGTSEKFRHIGNHFNVRATFKTKHTLCAMEPVRDAQQMRKCVDRIPCDCGWCCSSGIYRSLVVCIKEHKYNLMQVSSKNQNQPEMHMKVTKYVGNKWRCYRQKLTPPTRYTRNKPTSLVADPISQPSSATSPIWTPIIEVEVRTLQFHSV
jgi:hypothetical protein